MRLPRTLGTCVLVLFLGTGSAAREPLEELRIELLAGGDFVPVTPPAPRPATVRPWWKASHGATQGAGPRTLEDGSHAWHTPAGHSLRQALAADPERVLGITISGRVQGAGLLRVHASRADGQRATASFDVGSSGSDPVSFELGFEAVREKLGELPVPRFELEFIGGDQGATWSGLSAQVPFEAVDAEELRSRAKAELFWILDLWFERALDRDGPHSTAFLTKVFDVVTGEPLAPIDGGHNVFFDLLFRVTDLFPDEARYVERFDAFLADYLDLCLHPETGLPRPWDGRRDQPRDDVGVEIAAQLAFLIDVAEHGPKAHRARALAAAQLMAGTVLDSGLAPDGSVAAKYRPRDGRPDPHVAHLRRLDLPAQLGRLAAIEDGEFAKHHLAAAREAAAAVEYTLRWPGSWSEIDPGFDDIYGHFGERAVQLTAAAPEEAIFERISLGGLRHYAPLWLDAVRFGGNVAADQVRCWQIAMELIELRPELADEFAPVLRAAGHAHFQGQQYGNGAWGDVTVFAFDPKDNLQVGDLPGVPQNLAMGLATLYDLALEERGGWTRAELRALFATVLRTTQRAYKRPYGYLSTRRQAAGANPARGSIALATALVEMLERLKSDEER